MGMILTHHWDEGDTNETRSAPILGTAGNGDPDLDEVLLTGLPTGRRAGTPGSSQRTFSDSLGGRIAASTALGSESGDIDDIDDFISSSRLALTDYESTDTGEGDTVDVDITIATSVTYISDVPTSGDYSGASGNTLLSLNDPFNVAAANPTSNIKHVQINLSTAHPNAELDKRIVLNAFSCNIGTYKLSERTLP